MSDNLSPDVLADMEHAVQFVITGKHDPEFEKRVQAEAEKIREKILREHGVLEIGVPAIRELRE